MMVLWQNVKYALRMLGKNPGFTVIAVLTLALGIGANTAIFSVINSTLLNRLPYKDSSHLVVVWERNPHRGGERNVVSPANFFDWQEQNTVFDQMGVFFNGRAILTGDAEPEELPTQAVSANLFSLLGAKAALGRIFTAEDGQQGHENVVILSYGLWQRRFGADAQIVGKQIHMDGMPVTVVGVMPAGFQFYVKSGSLVRAKAQLWVPFAFTPNSRKRLGRYLMAIARLKPGISVSRAQAEMDAIAARLASQFPDFDKGWGIQLVPVRQEFSREIRTPLLVLLGAVGLVLLIACANVANLLLVRAAARQREISIRLAIGAGRWRVIRQMLTESILLALMGGVLGVLLAVWGVDAILAITPKELVDISGIRADLRILGFTAGVSLIAAMVFGLAPAFQSSRLAVGESLKEGGRSGLLGMHTHWLRNAFVVAELSLALVLLAGSGLLIRSFAHLIDVDPGFQPKNLLTFKVSLPNPPGSRYRQDQARAVFFSELLGRIRALPRVHAVSANSFLPFTGLAAATGFTIAGRPQPAAGEKPIVDVRVIEPDYFGTMGIPLLRGRLFDERESSSESHVVIINQSLANRYFSDEDPIGKRITIEMKQVNVPSEIVGVVGDVKDYGLDMAAKATAYWPYPELTYNSMTFVVRTKSDPLAVVPVIREEVQRLDKDEPISDVATMEQRLSASLSRARFSMLLMTVFGAMAVLLAVIGIYGVISHSVTQRTAEIGIRMTLGAQRSDVSRLVLTQGMRLSLLGILLGAGAALALTRLLQGLLFEVKPADPVTFVAGAIFLGGVSLIACYLPARRATRVDPIMALRYE